MRPYIVAIEVVLSLSVFSTVFAASEAQSPVSHAELLSGDRVLLGTVEEIAGQQARIDTGEVQPRYIPMNVRKAKKLLELKKGDHVEITINDQNLLVDVHAVGEGGHHLILAGQLAQPLVTGHAKAVIRNSRSGKEESHFIRPVARSKVASIPVDVDAVFLIDELDQIVDVTFGSTEAAHEAAELWKKKTPLKGNFSRISGVILDVLPDHTITIRTDEGKQQPYQVRPLVQHRLAHVTKGDAVVLLVDDENMVTDVAIPPHSKSETINGSKEHEKLKP